MSPWTSRGTEMLLLSKDIAVCVLSFMEHGRNVAPSAVLTGYLLLTCSSDAIQASLLYVAMNLRFLPSLAGLASAAQLVLLVLESRTKTSILRDPCKKVSPEAQTGINGSCVFWWVNGILKIGYTSPLTLGDVPPLSRCLDAAEARKAMLEEWSKRSKLALPGM